MVTRHITVFRRIALACAALVLLFLTGCSGGGSGADSISSEDVGGGREPAVAGAADMLSDAEMDSPDLAGGRAAVDPSLGQPKVISTGTVQLRSDDVAQAIFDARKVIDAHRGVIAEDDTDTDKLGEAVRSRMVLRIPAADFDEVMAELEEVGTLVSSHRQSTDVTTEVLDIDVRVEAQRRSIERIQILFDNATSIKDIVQIETELSQRQADLASLEAQQRYLRDQTSMSTITLTVERDDKDSGDDDHDRGFLAGLSSGWNALTSFLVGLATVGGALIPWLVLLALLGLVSWPALRKLRDRRRATSSQPETPPTEVQPEASA